MLVLAPNVQRFTLGEYEVGQVEAVHVNDQKLVRPVLPEVVIIDPCPLPWVIVER